MWVTGAPAAPPCTVLQLLPQGKQPIPKPPHRACGASLGAEMDLKWQRGRVRPAAREGRGRGAMAAPAWGPALARAPSGPQPPVPAAHPSQATPPPHRPLSEPAPDSPLYCVTSLQTRKGGWGRVSLPGSWAQAPSVCASRALSQLPAGHRGSDRRGRCFPPQHRVKAAQYRGEDSPQQQGGERRAAGQEGHTESWVQTKMIHLGVSSHLANSVHLNYSL